MDGLRDNPELLAKLIAMAKVAVAAEPKNEEWEFLLDRLEGEQKFLEVIVYQAKKTQDLLAGEEP